MATPPRQYLPKARQGEGCGSAGGGPRPKEGNAPRRRPFLNAAGDGTRWGSPRREKHAPLFVPLGFLVPVSRNPSWEAFSLVSGCRRGRVLPRFSRFPLWNFHRDIPSLSDARRLTNSTRLCPLGVRSPFLPLFSKARSTAGPPFHEVFPPSQAAPPPRRGHNGKLSFSFFSEYGRD